MSIILDVSRTTLIYLHIISMVVAAVSMVLLDYIVFKDEIRSYSERAVDNLATTVLFSLLGLWVTGLVVIGIDTGFELPRILQSGKLLAKLSVVTVLTLNGVAVHLYVLPRLSGFPRRASSFNLMTITIGVVSAVSWGYAAFLGIAKSLAAHLDFAGFMSLYLLALAAAWLFAVIVVRPRLLDGTMSAAKKPAPRDEISGATLP